MSQQNTIIGEQSFEWNQDHGCHREGIASPLNGGGDWDFVENENAAYRIARNAVSRILEPPIMAQMWMNSKAYSLAQEYMTEEHAKEFNTYWRWATDLQGQLEQDTCEIAALVVQNLPAKLTSLNEMLDASMVESGFCCSANIDAFIQGHMPGYWIPEMEQTLPDFKPEWLSIEGPNAPLERD